MIDIADTEISTFLSRNANSGDMYVLDREQKYFLNDVQQDGKYDTLNKEIDEMVQTTGQPEGFFQLGGGR